MNSSRGAEALLDTSESLADKVSQLEAIDPADMTAADQDAAARLLAQAARLFVAAGGQGFPSPRSTALSPTESAVSAHAFLQAQGLSVFEFAVWVQAAQGSLYDSSHH